MLGTYDLADIRLLEISVVGKDGGEFIVSPSGRIPTQTPGALEQVHDIFSGDLYIKKNGPGNPDTCYNMDEP